MRAEIINRINRAQSFANQNQISEASKEIEFCLGDIMRLNYFTLLDPIFEINSQIHTTQGNFESVLFDNLMRLSPLLNTPKPEFVFNNFIKLSSTLPPLIVPIPPPFIPLLPFKLNIKYEKQEIISGNKPNVIVTIHSYFPMAIKFDEIILHCNHNSGQTVQESIENVEVLSKHRKIVRKSIDIPPAVSSETISTIVLRIGNLSIKIDQDFGADLKVSPDASACQIGVKLPELCIIGAKLPFSITLTAGDQKLENLSLDFQYDEKIYPVSITGKHADKDIKRENHLGDIDPYQTVLLNLFIETQSPIITTVNMIVSFGTSLSGKGVFKRSMLFSFQPPFQASMNVFDENFEECPKTQIQSLERGCSLHIETILTNNISTPVTIKSLSSSIKSIDDEGLPTELYPGESYTFFGEIAKAGDSTIAIGYYVEGAGDCTFTLRPPRIEEYCRPVKYSFESPPLVIKHKEFECKVIIERDSTLDSYPEMLEVLIEIEKSQSFFYTGPLRKNIYISRNQKKEILLKFLALDTGSMFLPNIVLSDSKKDTIPPKVFKTPIVVAFH